MLLGERKKKKNWGGEGNLSDYEDLNAARSVPLKCTAKGLLRYLVGIEVIFVQGAGILHLPAPTPAQPPGRFPAESNQKIFVPVPAHFYHTGELLAKNLPKAAKRDVCISRRLSK